MQRARCYLIGETAVVLELEPPVTLASQKRIWRLAQRLVDMPNVVEAIPGMNNITVILRNPESLALDAIERLQRWWEESEALEPESRFIEIPVVYGGAAGPDLAVVAAHCGLSEKQVVELHSSVEIGRDHRYLLRGYNESPDATAPAFHRRLPEHHDGGTAIRLQLHALARKALKAAACCRFPFLANAVYRRA